MPYTTLKPTEDEFGQKKGIYLIEGTFQNMLYLCVDCFNDHMVEGEIVSKTDEELVRDYREQTEDLFKAVGPLLDDEWINDYWLVATPRVCDYSPKEYKKPLEKNNFIVTPFNYEDIELIEKIVIPSKVAGGSVRINTDKRKRLATNSCMDMYVAVELNDEHPNLSGLKDADKTSSQYSSLILGQALSVAQYAAEYCHSHLRTFLCYGVREKNGVKEPVMVEQYFDRTAKKTNNYCLGEGFVRGKIRKIQDEKLLKYMAFNDLFESRGNEFCYYGLSLEELRYQKNFFKENPWVKIEYPE